MDDKTRTELEAAAFRRLVAHLQERTDVQNIDMMNLAGFCRNCLSRWYREEAGKQGIEIPDPKAREIVYGMPYETGRPSTRASLRRPEEGLRQGAQTADAGGAPSVPRHCLPDRRPLAAHDHDAGWKYGPERHEQTVTGVAPTPLSTSFIAEPSLSRGPCAPMVRPTRPRSVGHARWQRRFEEDQGWADLGRPPEELR
jgi:hypothetical protein